MTPEFGGNVTGSALRWNGGRDLWLLAALRRATVPRSGRFRLFLPHLDTALLQSSRVPHLPSGWYWGRSSQFIDPPQDIPKQVPGHGDFGQLERDVAAVLYHPGADLDQLFAQRGSLP